MCQFVITSKPRRWFHIHFLVQVSLENGIIEIKFPKVRIVINCHREYDAYYVGIDYQAECGIKINTLSLSKTLYNKAIYVYIDVHIGISIDPEYPLKKLYFYFNQQEQVPKSTFYLKHQVPFSSHDTTQDILVVLYICGCDGGV